LTKNSSDRRRFDIALSFPGEHRAFVEQVAGQLAAAFGKERVLYDKYYEAEFARVDLDVYLPGLYRTQSELIVLFLSPDFKAKPWCNLEWRSIKQLIATVDARRIMLLRYGHEGDLAEIGILPGDGVIDYKGRPAHEIAEKIRERFYINKGVTPPPSSSPAPLPPAAQQSPASGALVLWQRKLAFLFEEEATAVDPGLKFSLLISIERAKAKIREHGGHA
jgi:hypothetical protein